MSFLCKFAQEILPYQQKALPLHHYSAFGDFSRSNLHYKKTQSRGYHLVG